MVDRCTWQTISPPHLSSKTEYQFTFRYHHLLFTCTYVTCPRVISKKSTHVHLMTHPSFPPSPNSLTQNVQVITATFQPHHPNTPLPPALASTLIDRFNCADGYTLYPDVLHYLQNLSQSPYRRANASHRIVVGVITNSDDRVPDVLTSLGLRVNRLRHGGELSTNDGATATAIEAKTEVHDIDFAIMSYDVGFEKPHRRIFDAATDVLKSILQADNASKVDDLEDWDLLYIGDEMEKDGLGATRAGWDAIIVDRDADNGGQGGQGELGGVSYKRRVEGVVVDVLSDFGAIKNLKGRSPLIMG